MSDIAAYEELHRLTELELELAGRGDLAAMAEVARERERLVATLPPTPPPAARELLERTLALQERTTIDLMRGREQLLAELDLVRRGRRAADAYGAVAERRVRRESLA